MRTISFRRSRPIGWVALTCAAFLTLVAEGRAQDVDWSSYMDYATLTKNCQDWVKAHSEIATLVSLGKSYKGRDLWLVTITNRSTGSAEDKPSLYVQAGIDSDEVITVQSAMYLLHRVLSGYGTDPAVTDLVDKYALYVAPNVIRDQSETFHQTPKRPRDSTTRPYDNDRDGLFDEDDMEDIDGDGRILQMRIRDPGGRTGAHRRRFSSSRTANAPGRSGEPSSSKSLGRRFKYIPEFTAKARRNGGGSCQNQRDSLP